MSKNNFPNLAFSELTGTVYIVISHTKKLPVDPEWFEQVHQMLVKHQQKMKAMAQANPDAAKE